MRKDARSDLWQANSRMIPKLRGNASRRALRFGVTLSNVGLLRCARVARFHPLPTRMNWLWLFLVRFKAVFSCRRRRKRAAPWKSRLTWPSTISPGIRGGRLAGIGKRVVTEPQVLLGETRGQVAQGMSRLFALWSAARTPTGAAVPLSSPGTDELGELDSQAM